MRPQDTEGLKPVRGYETTLQKIERIEKELAELKAEQKKPVEVVGQYEPDFEDGCFSDGVVFLLIGQCIQEHRNLTKSEAKIFKDCGVIFRTREQAERRLQNIKTHERLRRLAAEAWVDRIEHPSEYNARYWLGLDYSHANETYMLHILCGSESYPANAVYFPTEESAQAAIDEIGEDKVWQYVEGDLV